MRACDLYPLPSSRPLQARPRALSNRRAKMPRRSFARFLCIPGCAGPLFSRQVVRFLSRMSEGRLPPLPPPLDPLYYGRESPFIGGNCHSGFGNCYQAVYFFISSLAIMLWWGSLPKFGGDPRGPFFLTFVTRYRLLFVLAFSRRRCLDLIDTAEDGGD